MKNRTIDTDAKKLSELFQQYMTSGQSLAMMKELGIEQHSVGLYHRAGELMWVNANGEVFSLGESIRLIARAHEVIDLEPVYTNVLHVPSVWGKVNTKDAMDWNKLPVELQGTIIDAVNWKRINLANFDDPDDDIDL